MSNVIAKDALAKIAIAKNLIKEYKSSESDRTVYLNDGTEFQIYLKNPYQTHLGIKIYVNNKSIGNMLVLRPGQSFWLDRFVDDNKKFLFSTYHVEDTGEMRYAINNNGKVKIEFYHEREQKIAYTPYHLYNGSGCVYYNGDSTVLNYCNTITGDAGSTITTASASTSTNTSSFPTSASFSLDSCLKSEENSNSTSRNFMRKSVDKNAMKNIDQNLSLETGRVEKGGRSDQEFEYCDIEFEYYSFKTENILILPNSRKQIRVEDTRRKYCSQCGKKVSPKDKFCSNCGAKLD